MKKIAIENLRDLKKEFSKYVVLGEGIKVYNHKEKYQKYLLELHDQLFLLEYDKFDEKDEVDVLNLGFVKGGEFQPENLIEEQGHTGFWFEVNDKNLDYANGLPPKVLEVVVKLANKHILIKNNEIEFELAPILMQEIKYERNL